MKKTDFLKIILGVLLGAIGLMLYKAFSNPSIPELADNCKLEVVEGESTELTVVVDDECTAHWYNQEKGGDPIKENSTTYKLENLHSSTTLYVEAVSLKNARKVSKKRLKIEVKVKEQIAEIPATEQGQGEEPHEHEAPTVETPGGHEPINDDQDNDGIKDEFDECQTEKGVRELNGCPYQNINLLIEQDKDDPNFFTFNSNIWNAISDNSLTFEFSCNGCSLNNSTKPSVVVNRGNGSGRFSLNSDSQWVGSKGYVKVKQLNNYRKYIIDGRQSKDFTEGLTCKTH